ncbi:divisome protein SepX/GlpR [Solicola gregarius]|uniref:Uncharacterized protein n=1 Tax=Solicola gregarius TaxID=2908642 RepID=A0AA46TJU8_9ACTN|nr:hypothetical protein [Solicola gregarius]UYM06631.1 hypothetical protein L0C25_06050 [Solicola gregarius]
MVTGLIYAAIVVLWAAYLVPLALRRYDEASHDRPVETSSRMRILRRGRSESATAEADDGNRPESATPAESAKPSAPVKEADVSPVAVTEQRESTRMAIRRRRRTLGVLVFATALVAGSAYALIVPWWSVAIPAGLVVAWLVACRIQVLGEIADAAAPKAMGDEPNDEPTIVISAQFDDYRPERKNVMLEEPLDEGALEEQVNAAVPVATEEGGSLWDPVPVTLPTYVDKPRAARTVRTIDFNGSDAWTSGHVEGEQTEMPAAPEESEEHRRAVGD